MLKNEGMTKTSMRYMQEIEFLDAQTSLCGFRMPFKKMHIETCNAPQRRIQNTTEW